MGPGMMGGYGPQSNAQPATRQDRKIQETTAQAMGLMGKMQDEQAHMNEQYYSDNAMMRAQQELPKMSDSAPDVRPVAQHQKQIDAVLTKEQPANRGTVDTRIYEITVPIP